MWTGANALLTAMPGAIGEVRGDLSCVSSASQAAYQGSVWKGLLPTGPRPSHLLETVMQAQGFAMPLQQGVQLSCSLPGREPSTGGPSSAQAGPKPGPLRKTHHRLLLGQRKALNRAHLLHCPVTEDLTAGSPQGAWRKMSAVTWIVARRGCSLHPQCSAMRKPTESACFANATANTTVLVRVVTSCA